MLACTFYSLKHIISALKQVKTAPGLTLREGSQAFYN